MKTIEMTGKTVDEALKNALNELKLTKEEVDIEIIDEGSKGIFNLIGNKPARIKITKKKSFLNDTFLFSILSVALGLLVGAIALILSGHNPITVYAALIDGCKS